MKKYNKSGDAVSGKKIVGLARKVEEKNNKNPLFPQYNNKQFILKRKTDHIRTGQKSECYIDKSSKEKIKNPYSIIKIHNQKNDSLFGNEIYCECAEGKLTSCQGERFRKLGNRHGQGCILKSKYALAIIMKEFQQTPTYILTDCFSKEIILNSKDNDEN